jgi:hypothetical protein
MGELAVLLGIGTLISSACASSNEVGHNCSMSKRGSVLHALQMDAMLRTLHVTTIGLHEHRVRGQQLTATGGSLLAGKGLAGGPTYNVNSVSHFEPSWSQTPLS